MADQPTATTPPTEASQPQQSPRMNVVASVGSGAAGGIGSAAVLAFLWNWWAVREWGAPQIDIGTATSMAIMLTPIFMGVEYIVKWAAGWIMRPPPATNRRASR